MTDWPDYELIDFGAGRKLERFGDWVLDRPCPAADKQPQSSGQWKEATARYEGDRADDGSWKGAEDQWLEQELDFSVRLAEDMNFKMQLCPLPSGQIGIFFEQFANWQWIARQIKRASKVPRVLNLFAYTGGSTLASAVAGAEVTHVDAAKSVVNRARQNAEASGLTEHPIRWIVDDALKFCQREVRRGNTYDAVILDPPTYGHGSKGQRWLIQHDLLPLLEACSELIGPQPLFALATCHTPGIGPPELSAYLSDGLFGTCRQPGNSGQLFLQTSDGRKLASGVFARWPA